MLRLYPPAPVTVRTLEEPLDLKVDMTQGPGAPNAAPGKVELYLFMLLQACL